MRKQGRWKQYMIALVAGCMMLNAPIISAKASEVSSAMETLSEAEEAPTTEEPTTEAPTTEEPTTEEPTAEEPTTEEPTTEEPTTEEPTTEEPTTEEPTTEEPTTEAPTTEEPTTEEPTTEEPTTEEPTTETLTDSESSAESEEIPVQWELSSNEMLLEQGEIRRLQIFSMMMIESDMVVQEEVPVWTSSDESVVKVSEDGILTAGNPGEATVSVSYAGEVKSCRVAVRTAAAFGVSVESTMGRISGYVVNNVTYLFLPNTVTSGTLQIKYTGVVNSVSSGHINPEQKIIETEWNGKKISLNIKLGNGQARTVTVMASKIPSMFIQLNGVTLDILHQDKDIKYKGNSVVISDIYELSNNLNDSNVEMKGRGNSSWNNFDKKGYQIKFDKKTSVLGMDPAKKWCLIGNPNDGSMMRNKLAYTLAANGSFAYTVQGEFVDLWVNGSYCGVYLVTEKVEIGSTRLDLKDPKGVLVELDNAFYRSEEIYFTSSVTGMHYVQKEAVDEDTTAGIDSFRVAMESVERLLQNGAGWSEITALIDAQSFADFYLVNEMLMNAETLCTSFYLYKDGDGDVIHAGPVWDFDTSMDANGTQPFQYAIATKGAPFSMESDIFRCLCQYKEFVQLVEKTFNETYKDKYADMIPQIDKLYENIKDSADMNYSRWDSLGTTDDKGGFILETYIDNIIHLKDWLLERISTFAPFNMQSKVTSRNGSATAKVLTVEDTAKQLDVVRAAVWSEENHQDDIVWYYGTRSGSTWTIQFDLASHHSNGKFLVHIYGVKNNDAALIGAHTLNYFGSVKPGLSVGYEVVFDADYYSRRYPDLKAVFGSDAAGLFNHFKTYGMKEGRQANTQFDPDIYRANYPDLRKAFGDDIVSYYMHYIEHGYNEKRIASRLLDQDTDDKNETPETPEVKPEEPEIKPETPDSGSTGGETANVPAVYNGVDYQRVFNADYYLAKYPDLKAAFKSDKAQALRHFVVHGMKEGRQASAEFKLSVYRSNYADLRQAFGNNNVSYYMHYIEHGYDEHRTASEVQTEKPSEPETKPSEPETKPETPSGGTTVHNGINYSLVFDASYYLVKYPDLKAAFGNDAAAAFNHFITNGMKEGRQAKAGFNVYAYKNRYADLRQAFGSNLTLYYQHYVKNGYKENRIGN